MIELGELGFEVREERGVDTLVRLSPKHYNRLHPPGHVAVHVNVPATASIWQGIVVGPGMVIPDHAILRGPEAVLRSTDQVLVIGPVGRSRDWLTALFVPKGGGSREQGADIWINRGCFCGTVEEFLEEVRLLAPAQRWVYERLAEFLRVVARERAG